jgi:hypothetical protein
VDGLHESFVRGIELWKMMMAERKKAGRRRLTLEPCGFQSY